MGTGIVERGSVVLIKYLFTDLSGSKVRPAIVLTPDEFIERLDDVICLFISSVVSEKHFLLPTDFLLESVHPDFSQTGLKRSSVVRCHKLALLHKTLVTRVLGKMEKSLMGKVNKRLILALGL